MMENENNAKIGEKVDAIIKKDIATEKFLNSVGDVDTNILICNIMSSLINSTPEPTSEEIKMWESLILE